MPYAIDISYSQSTNIDFVSMRSAVNTVIMKAGGSNTGSRYVDSKYRYFEPRARAAGMTIGHYWFNGYGDPVADADFFVNNLSGYQRGDYLALDIESEGSMGYWGPAQALAFVNRVKQRTGRVCDVYMSSSVTRAQNWSAVRDAGAKLWVAQYGNNNGSPQGSPNIAYWPTYRLWQFTSNGSVPGYAARVDQNIINQSEWSSEDAQPIKEDDPEDMARPVLVQNMENTQATNPQYGWVVFLGDNGEYHTLTGSQRDAWVAQGFKVLQTTQPGHFAYFLSEWENQRAYFVKYGGSANLSDAQTTAIADAVIAKLPTGALTEDQVKAAVTAAVTPVVNGAVTNLAQNNADQTATIKGFTFKAQ